MKLNLTQCAIKIITLAVVLFCSNISISVASEICLVESSIDEMNPHATADEGVEIYTYTSLRNKIDLYNAHANESVCNPPVGSFDDVKTPFKRSIYFLTKEYDQVVNAGNLYYDNHVRKIDMVKPIAFTNTDGSNTTLVVGNYTPNGTPTPKKNNQWGMVILNFKNVDAEKVITCGSKQGAKSVTFRNMVVVTKGISKNKLMNDAACLADGGDFFVCSGNLNPKVVDGTMKPNDAGWCDVTSGGNGETDDDGDGFCEDENLDDKCDDGAEPGDCNDVDENVNPGEKEICNNGKDDDCDGLIDNDDPECSGSENPDGDGDGYCDDDAVNCPDGKETGDCDDSNSSVHPGATEIPNNNVDENCDGSDGSCALDASPEEISVVQGSVVDYKVKYKNLGGYVGNGLVYVKGLHNSMSTPETTQIASGAEKTIKLTIDAATPVGTYNIKFTTNKKDTVMQPLSSRRSFDVRDNLIDKPFKINSISRMSSSHLYLITDITARSTPSYADLATQIIQPGMMGNLLSLITAQCSDEVKVIVTKNENDGEIDNDGDGYCEDANGNGVCDLDPDADAGDCNDNNAAINPGAAEVCSDSMDNNCNGLVDENCSGNDTETDNDGDGYCEDGNGNGVCDNDNDAQPGDCDDTNPQVNPAAAEVCDGLDNNCDGGIDNLDADNDGYYACEGATDPDGNGNGSGNGPGNKPVDCNDSNAAINPGETELCADNIDQDCDGAIDEGCAGNPNTDDDGDGFCEATSCSDGSQPGDCDDTDASVHPGAEEICTDKKDNDCDGLSDSFDPACSISPSQPGNVGWGANLEGGAGCSLNQATAKSQQPISILLLVAAFGVTVLLPVGIRKRK